MSEPVAAAPAPSPPWWKTSEGSTGRLLQLCLCYFTFYAITGVAVKCFTDRHYAVPGLKMNDVVFLAYSTLGGTTICLAWVLVNRWYRLKSTRLMTWAGLTFPSEFLYIIPSGICTAVVIPTTTLMYMLLPSVMVAMVIMRACVIVISRIVDAAQIKQGILQRRVYAQEEIAVVFAILAVATQLFWAVLVPVTPLPAPEAGAAAVAAAPSGPVKPPDDRPDFGHNLPAQVVLGSYVVAYLFRIYLMNYFKNTRGKGVPLDNNGFFAVEQIAAAAAMALASVFLFASPTLLGWDFQFVLAFRGSITEPSPVWGWAVLAGVAYGAVAFFSVFIFMFKGRTATFAGLVNRLTSLVAGTTSSIIFWLVFVPKSVTLTSTDWILLGQKPADWASLGLILVAVAFLTLAERKRASELAAALEAAKA